MLNLEQIAINAVKKALNSDSLKESIEKKITETIESEITYMFRSYSDFGKSFEKAVQEKMMLNVDELNFTNYNHWLAVTIKERFKAHTERPTFNQIDTMLNEIMPVSAIQVSLDDLIDGLRNSKDKYDSDHSGRFAVCFSRNSGCLAKYITIGFDEEFKKGGHGYSSDNPKTASDCSYSIKVDISSHKVVGFDMGYRGNTDSAKIITWKHDFESKLFNMYAAGSVIDLGDYLEAFNNMQEGDDLNADDLGIEYSYKWAGE
ncbi:hypothetical protein HPQ32_14010 [Photobacterium carnosum]|uniref:hypothetical protein n=1 Tax=Photobacterium carnosum TaxID=2023717 RepID=UPI001C9231C2|nr:hypothetical protein [Photobacterium carnosum]MBY3789538.1 hypothetical protein [Photobacterium carnosum]MCD9534597.1 hypothetical protein [Photobacterium carnosum]